MQLNNQEKLRFLVAGETGFIGSAVIHYLIWEMNHEAINVLKLT